VPSASLSEPSEVTPVLGEIGTPSGDRPFRPDVQGLRALAVALVVIYHAGVPKVTGGFVGVDVFFVISGYVITGLLLRERARTGGTSLLGFYARRARRILPAAALVIAGTTIASFYYLGFVTGAQDAADAGAAALFVANFHFITLGTNYETAQALPSPLQHFWSLAVEEQFYLVYPATFIVVASVIGRVRFETKLMIMLVAITIASYTWSVVETSANGTAAYFSPFTRAWELALGAIVAVVAPRCIHLVHDHLSAGLTWLGIAAIIYSAAKFNNGTAFPGSVAAIPVIGTALVIAAGTSAPRFGAEAVLRLKPIQWLGAISYELYLLHWPILTISAEQTTSKQSVGHNLLLVALALGLSIILYRVIDSPIRHSRFLSRRPVISLGLIPLCVGISLAIVVFEQYRNYLPVHII
jgi:peptidoglycan/LPS O-acetylase OafA/YrhL